MSSALRHYAPDPYREPRPQPRTPPPRPDPAPERRAVPMSGRELAPLAVMFMLIAVTAAMTVLYLAAFATGAGQSRREIVVNEQISQAQVDTWQLEAEVERLQRRNRIEAEANRLGLVRVAPATVDRMELPGEVYQPEYDSVDVSAVPAGVGTHRTDG